MSGTGTVARQASVAIVGAGDYIGAAIARRFAAGGYLVVCGRRNAEKLEPLVNEITAAGGGRSGSNATRERRRRSRGFSMPPMKRRRWRR